MIPKRIETLKTLDELCVYACSKVRNDKNWSIKCADCKKCPVGTKAEELLEVETAPKVTDEPKVIPKEKDKKFIEALKHESPTGWLVEKGYYSTKDSAGNALKRWSTKGGLITKQEYDAYLCRIRTNAGNKRGEISKANAKTRIESLFDGKGNDPKFKAIAMLEDADPNSSCVAVYNRAHKWKTTYPELNEKYNFFEAVKSFGNDKNKKRKVSDMLKELKADISEKTDDEISIEDFLQENDISKSAAEEVTETTKAATDVKIDIHPTPEQETIRDEFGKKRKELKVQIALIEQKMSEFDVQLKDAKSKLEMLDSVALMFGLTPIANKP